MDSEITKMTVVLCTTIVMQCKKTDTDLRDARGADGRGRGRDGDGDHLPDRDRHLAHLEKKVNLKSQLLEKSTVLNINRNVT